MYAQTIMYKNDTGGLLLGGSGVQFNPNLVNLGTLGLDSIEFMNSSPAPMSTTTGGGGGTGLALTANTIGVSNNSSTMTITSGSQTNTTSGVSTMSHHSKQASISSLTSTSSVGTVSSSNKALVKSGPFGSGFSLFGFIRKGSVAKEDAAFSEQAQIQKQQQQMAQQQQQMAQEQQQQKLKQQKTDLKTIGQYIKSFESIVIKSLRQYTLTTSVNLQARILELLTTLIFLKVTSAILFFFY